MKGNKDLNQINPEFYSIEVFYFENNFEQNSVVWILLELKKKYVAQIKLVLFRFENSSKKGAQIWLVTPRHQSSSLIIQVTKSVRPITLQPVSPVILWSYDHVKSNSNHINADGWISK